MLLRDVCQVHVVVDMLFTGKHAHADVGMAHAVGCSKEVGRKKSAQFRQAKGENDQGSGSKAQRILNYR